ncbi:MAG: glycosyltransferase [Bacteroidales bacterium]|nr:glycosyltransferase [Bacteroidales bacterium]
MNFSGRLRILHLVRWYPNRYDSMFGLFVQRHVEAVALANECIVIYAQPVPNLPVSMEFEIEKTENILCLSVFYRESKSSFPLISDFVKGWKYLKAIRLALGWLKENSITFDFIHVHVLTRLGLVALWFKIKMGIPFGITEHWSRYLPETNGFQGVIRKTLTRFLVRRASFVSTVTLNLQKAMMSHNLFNQNYFVLPNVVNTRMNYNPAILKNDVFTFIHISTFDNQAKNIQGIINAIAELSAQRTDFKCVFVGEGFDFDAMKQLASATISNEECYEFTGLLEHEVLATRMMQSHVLLLFSNYENFPVVINEALTLGLPVLSTDVGGISEVINSENGVLVSPRNVKELVHAMSKFVDGYYSFKSDEIRQKFSESYSAENIGKLLNNYYLQALKR